MICTQGGFFMPQNIQYVDGRMELRTNFDIILGAFGGERIAQLESDFGNGVLGECKLYPCEL